ncbi:hypothetical protein EBZ38_13345 [bacterium]|nr:hypothetical protein [bacterium]NDC95633.1 hypothetical protein [bacterium]NDD85242.1 hypothetical protein [bacterium]
MSHALRVNSINSWYPEGATPVTASSGNVAASVATATITPAAGKTAWVTGLMIFPAGATAGAIVNATLTGLVGGTITIPVGAPTGAAVAGYPIVLEFPAPVPATAIAQAVSLSMPSLGAGNTNAAVTLLGFTV